jgi:glyoxylase-like metal-dependent hydrolase (beta-lactamase superfamily II)
VASVRPVEEKAPEGAGIYRWVTGLLENNVYVVADVKAARAAIIDPSMDSDPILEWLREKGLSLDYVLITHGHFDHAFRAGFFARETGAQVAMSEADAPMLLQLADQAVFWGFQADDDPPKPSLLLKDGDEVRIGSLALKVAATPGHSPGGVSFILDGPPAGGFVGDLIFAAGVGRTDLPGGSLEHLMSSIRGRILSLPDDTALYPGHGPVTTVGREKASNPFIS